ncbi:molybdopterin-dependent oxidoreductase [Candidatus Entotheonella palauensis]|uniref:molybdopterin-dependent oxidoreductase n=1 Tax=Candidatus Entotheonella palauensis TaxID=93172 RepID=UPI0015C43DBA|nr:molybdopterin-dependent oxidoreductase [Candidatus Entotheonella palauensis]
MTNPDVKLDRLPVFDNHYGRPDQWSGLLVDGLVAEPRTFSATDLETFAAAVLTDDFRCEEGWVVNDQKWEGVSLAELLQVVRPLPEARYAEISASDFMVAVPLTDSDQTGSVLMGPTHALLANRLNGAALPEEHGGPCRLVLTGGACYTSIKWVDHIRLTAEQPEETAQQIASQRNG